MKKKLLFFTIILVIFAGCGNKGNAVEAEVAEDEGSVSVQIDVSNEIKSEAEDALQYNSNRRVICYGDSMTEGTGGNGVTMPNTLENLSGATVLNYGVYADSTSCVSARMGANPQYLNDDVLIPADSTPVPAQCSGKYGWEMLCNFGDAGLNNVYIDGIEGYYFITDDGVRMFSRITPGEEKLVKRDTQLITHAMMDKKPDDIIVIWAGNNDNPQTVDEIQPTIDKINEMLDYLNTSEYVIISVIASHERTPVIDEFNKMLNAAYGEHFLDLRSYLINDALNVLNIEPTDTDKADIKSGDIPNSLRSDEIHGNSDYYTLAGKKVYEKLVTLGYLK